MQPYDVYSIRKQFPIFEQKINGKPLAYLDSAASAAKPRAVIQAMTSMMERDYANVHRGLHTLSMRSTDAFEQARRKVADFINAQENEIVFTRNATESINLVAASFARHNLMEGEAIVITAMEHHANIVPWQILAEQMSLDLKVIPIDQRGVLDMEAYEAVIKSGNIGLVAVTHVSNVLGSVNPVANIIDAAHAQGVPVLIDACQSILHMKIDVRALDADFLVFSGHKLYGPTGIGVLYGKAELLEKMPPYQAGGEMIKEVRFEQTSFAEPPLRFEAGTPAIIEAVGLGAAIDWISDIGLERIAAHEAELLEYARLKTREIPEMRILGTAENKVSVLSFYFDHIHAHDLATILDQEGVAVRAGHHCAQPLLQFFGRAGVARASLAAYTTYEEIDQLFAGIKTAHKLLS